MYNVGDILSFNGKKYVVIEGTKIVPMKKGNVAKKLIKNNLLDSEYTIFKDNKVFVKIDMSFIIIKEVDIKPFRIVSKLNTYVYESQYSEIKIIGKIKKSELRAILTKFYNIKNHTYAFNEDNYKTHVYLIESTMEDDKKYTNKLYKIYKYYDSTFEKDFDFYDETIILNKDSKPFECCTDIPMFYTFDWFSSDKKIKIPELTTELENLGKNVDSRYSYSI